MAEGSAVPLVAAIFTPFCPKAGCKEELNTISRRAIDKKLKTGYIFFIVNFSGQNWYKSYGSVA
jgi:hypothetical protein